MNYILKRVKEINKVLILLTFSDVFSWGTYTVISALTGLYLANKLGENTIEYVGIGTAIYFFVRSIMQIPIGRFTDKYKKDKDEIFLLALGIVFMGIPFLFYPQITTSYHYFLLQAVFGVGVALDVTTWRKLFALNIDGGREGRQYARYETIMSAFTGVLSILGGVIANMGEKYFDMVISFSGFLIIFASIWILLIYVIDERKSN
jgi:MFS family permease